MVDAGYLFGRLIDSGERLPWWPKTRGGRKPPTRAYSGVLKTILTNLIQISMETRVTVCFPISMGPSKHMLSF